MIDLFDKRHRLLEGGRNLLHVVHENDFAAYCRGRGCEVSFDHPKKGAFEAFRVQRPEGDGWNVVYRRLGAEHFTVPIGIEDLVRRFIAQRKVDRRNGESK